LFFLFVHPVLPSLGLPTLFPILEDAVHTMSIDICLTIFKRVDLKDLKKENPESKTI